VKAGNPMSAALDKGQKDLKRLAPNFWKDYEDFNKCENVVQLYE
jgi:hypothetical protein